MTFKEFDRARTARPDPKSGNRGSHMKTWRNSVLLTTLMVVGCLPAPRAYRIFLPPPESARRTEERLQELQSQFEHGLLTEEEYTRKREEILMEAQFERTLEKTTTPRPRDDSERRLQ